MTATVIDTIVKQIVMTTRYSPYQVYGVLEKVAKYGENTRPYLTKKQNKILDLIMYYLCVE